MNKLIAITGGIGAGKSVVSRILTSMGYDVYDTDSRAKSLMDSSELIKARLVDNFGEKVVVDGSIDRKLLAQIVFSDPDKLARLNKMVHGAVIDDVKRYCSVANPKDNIVFVETAILYQSGLDSLVDEVWEVTAPEDVRIERVVRRNNMSPGEVRARIASQTAERIERTIPVVHTLFNDDVTPLLPQVLVRLDSIRSLALR